MPELVAGVDAGGTHVRVLVADGSGRRLGTGVAAGANPVSRGLEVFAAQLDTALTAALSTVDPAEVGLLALALAGGGALGLPALDAALAPALRRLGLTCPWVLISDMEAAFAAGTGEPDGLVVLSGTGAVVAELRAGEMVRYLDGTGWLLGDVGSGMWLGLAAVRAAIADREGSGPPTALTAEVAAAFGVDLPADSGRPGSDPGIRALVTAAYDRRPISLSELAPAVSRLAAAGDAVAAGLVGRAATRLLDEAALLVRDAPDLRIAVLAGGVLLADGPLRDAVRSGIEARGLTVREARDGAAGATWCGLGRLLGPRPADVHDRLVPDC